MKKISEILKIAKTGSALICIVNAPAITNPAIIIPNVVLVKAKLKSVFNSLISS